MTKIDTRPVRLPDDKQQSANHALAQVRAYLDDHRTASQVTVTVEDGDGRESLALPREAVELLATLLAHLSAGRAVSVVPADAELTTQQAADMLNVSRPFLIGLLEAGEIEYRTVGSHRRITASSVLEYQRRDDHRRRAVADELTELGQEMGTI
ncbi:helix-turn-helix domain-containing protein [Streptomyces lonarensis]|uniref:Helix-turn-helix domain-containing protein n=1 Tax=Streptomyces lonarensis TaxID=700599 RepID=A0A7X6HXX3_9ACTN|nr:helix-turn-helix domain-containing protein [Streptomyces lonarensis]NJQ04993.1 helix-turn-helix domain-containing protein [Streptomyces lonarensis]